MTISMIIAAVLICLGMLFMLASLIGIVRLPDFFTRLHAQGVGDTLGAFLILAGMIAAVGANLLSIKILLIFIIIVLTNPIGTNLMMIAAINKEDYQGYSTLMSGGDKKEEEPVPEAGQPELKEQKAAEKGKTAEVKEPKAAEKGKTAEVKEPKAAEKGKTAEVKEHKAPEKKQTRREKKPEGERKEPASEKKPKAETKPNGENKNPKGEKKERKGDEKEPAGEKKEQNAHKKKGGRRKSNKPSMRMNKTELIAAAAKRGIEVPEGATKREILDLIYSNNDKKRS